MSTDETVREAGPEDSRATITVSITGMPGMKELIEEALGAECRHAGEPWAGSENVGCSDDCGSCRVRVLAYALMEVESDGKPF